jgi:hypothetical protein
MRDLTAALTNKHRCLAEALDLKPGQTLLDIGGDRYDRIAPIEAVGEPFWPRVFRAVAWRRAARRLCSNRSASGSVSP